MKKPHINIVHYMSKTANLEYGGELQQLAVEFFFAAISVALTIYGFTKQWDLLIPIFIVPAVLGTITFCHSLYHYISDHLGPGIEDQAEKNREAK